jgi:sigma-E factor negative regulatory protein RseA
MTQDISSLMDGELEAHEAGRVVQACCSSEEQKGTWYVYHVIGDAMRGHAPRDAFPHRTLAALREQPTVLAPRRRIVDTPFTRIALAAAASVATIGIVGWLGLQGGQIRTESTIAKAAPATAGVATNVAANVPSNVPANGTMAVSSNQPVLNVQDYLTVHRQIPSPEFYRQVSSQAPATAR